jgi:ATP-dependent protease ClpP protease subunit
MLAADAAAIACLCLLVLVLLLQVKAVVLRINSPGGSAVASDMIAREVQLLRDSGKPVVACMGDVAASGGYYIAGVHTTNSCSSKQVDTPASMSAGLCVDKGVCMHGACCARGERVIRPEPPFAGRGHLHAAQPAVESA